MLLYGRKRWFLSRPYHAGSRLSSAASTLHWLLNTTDASPRSYRALRRQGLVQTFVQEPGDLVYIPRAHRHATMNLQSSVAVATQFVREIALAHAAGVGTSELLAALRLRGADPQAAAGPAWAHIPISGARTFL